jgi:hypothetical protein
MSEQCQGSNWSKPGSVFEMNTVDLLAREAGSSNSMDSTSRSQIMNCLAIGLRLTLSAGLAAGLTGCEATHEYSLTYRLWNNSTFSQFNEPSTNGNVQVFQVARNGELLVTYDEISESNDHLRRRAFFLNANRARLEAGRKPRFVNPRKAADLAELPLVRVSANASNVPPASPVSPALSADGRRLTLPDDNQKPATIALPTYETAGGPVARVLVTPLAVTGDAVMVGVVLGVVAAYAWAAGGGCWQH